MMSMSTGGILLPLRFVQSTRLACKSQQFLRRHVVLPPEIAQHLPKNRLLSENEWRGLGVQQSRGWEHYAVHRPEPHIMLFRRPKNYGQPQQMVNPMGQPQVVG
eukprot:GHRR01023143.1.p1 GENE.GHRR01023143.1~~GHRR01023143.1.p1  ORF type:complete len:104 (+),score=21.69 GHRR01023143.1:376-687(+)